jgi:hypothetical protein
LKFGFVVESFRGVFREFKEEDGWFRWILRLKDIRLEGDDIRLEGDDIRLERDDIRLEGEDIS